jgi:hypothetical protein
MTTAEAGLIQFTFTHLILLRFLLMLYYYLSLCWLGGTRWCSWLRHCATSRKVAGSIPDDVSGVF